jgi:hypothetical protein
VDYTEAVADPSPQPGIYAHFKNPQHHYQVHGLARHSETGETLVVYRPLFSGSDLENTGQQYWVRPVTMFNEQVDRDDYTGPRFTYVGPPPS